MIEAEVKTSKFNITQHGNKFLIGNKELTLDIEKVNPSLYHILRDSKSYKIHLIRIDSNSKTATVKVNNKLFQVSLRNKLDLLLDDMGLETGNESSSNTVNAPMPGLILDISVNVGDKVQKGETLLILEAMKMENAIKSPKDGIISAVKIKSGESVEKNQPLVEF